MTLLNTKGDKLRVEWLAQIVSWRLGSGGNIIEFIAMVRFAVLWNKDEKLRRAKSYLEGEE
jgi:hypothetical protein